MTNQAKAKLLAPWINPAERITVDFKDVTGLNAEVFGCTENVVYLLFQGAFPHMKEQITIPLRAVQVGEDHGTIHGTPMHLFNGDCVCGLIKVVRKECDVLPNSPCSNPSMS